MRGRRTPLASRPGCAAPLQDLIVSNSEDKALRVWDMSKRIGVQVGWVQHGGVGSQPAS